ncbi:MAG: DUF6516 family protein [Bacillota bacterium]|nr:DUF6516 family protein [Bacillota bacterium]
MVQKKEVVEIGLETLLDLDGEIFAIDEWYWVKFEARRVDPTEHIPHGIRYSLTLHDKNNRRIIGYDNAHGIKKPRRKRFSGKRIVWDHKHENEKISSYEFETAYNLLRDFWNDVENIISG